jgi:hypothetical protein
MIKLVIFILPGLINKFCFVYIVTNISRYYLFSFHKGVAEISNEKKITLILPFNKRKTGVANFGL